MNQIKNYAILFSFAVLLSLPLFMNSSFINGHDILLHLNWLKEFNTVFREGVLYPRWLPETNGGYGSPTFIFYSPLIYYIGTFIHFLVPSLTLSLKIVCLIGLFLSGLTMYFYGCLIFPKTNSGLIAGLLYMVLPYHLVDLFKRAAIAEFFAFVWLPLILFFIHSYFQKDHKLKFLFGLSLTYAGLILTHLATGFIFSFVLFTYIIFQTFKNRDLLGFLCSSVAVVAGLALSGFFLIPVIFERQFVHIDWYTECPGADYKINFLFSYLMLGKPSTHFNAVVSKVAIIQEIAAIFAMLILFWIKKRFSASTKKELHFFSILNLVGFFLMTSHSKVIWKMIPSLQTIQFPWRWQLIQVLSTTFLIAAIMHVRRQHENFVSIKNWHLKGLVLVLGGIILINIFYSGRLLKNVGYLSHDMSNFYEKYIRKGFIAFRPIWLKDRMKVFDSHNLKKVDLLNPNSNRSEGVFNGSIKVIKWMSTDCLFEVQTPSTVLLRIKKFWYPGWVVKIDGEEVEIKIEEDSGAMLVNVTPGHHKIHLRFKDTPLRFVSKIISVSVLILYLILLVVSKQIPQDLMITLV